MTTQYAVLPARSGRSYTAKLFAASDLTTEITVTSITVTELAAKGLFRAAIVKPAVVAAGDYVLIYLYGTVAAAIGYFTFAGADGETATETPPTVELDPAALRSALGMSAADLDDQLDAILSAATAAAGTGARTVTVTVNDGTTVLQNAVVRFTEGSNTYRALTNASGIATFNLDDATYTVAVSKVGYHYAGTTMIVNGTETATYSMSAINVTPGTGDLTTGYLTCLDEEGVAEEGVSVRCQVVQIPSSGTGFAYDSAVQLETSAADGLVEFAMIKGARYLVWRGSIKPPQGITPVLISASAGSTTALGSLIGE